MIALDEEALICDLAETYQIYDYQQLPLTRVAVFSCGLRDDSRIKLRMGNQQVALDKLLLASVSDKLSNLLWYKTEDGQKRRNPPKSLVDLFTNVPEKPKENISFTSGQDFDAMRMQLLQNIDDAGGGN